MRLLKLLLLSFLLYSTCIIHAQHIDSVVFKGLTKTSEPYLRSLINCKKGIAFSAKAIKEDEQILNNLNLFFSVESDWIFIKEKMAYTVIFIIEESTYIFPLLSLSGFKDVIKIQAGLNHINWRGEQKTIGIWYQFYDRHSFSMYHKVPRHKNNKTGHDLILSKYSTLEPLYFPNVKSNFNFDNYSIFINGKYWLNKKTKLELGFTPIYEVYKQNDNVETPLYSTNFTFFKYRINSRFVYDNLNYKYERISGEKLNIYVESIQTHMFPMASFFMFKYNWIKHYKIKKRSNISFKHEIGISTNNDSPFSPFVLDGFLNLRGIGNRIVRGTGIHFINFEYRYTFLKNDFFIGQIVSFADVGSIRLPGASWKSLINPNNSNLFTGLGVRFHSQKFYRTIFRVDYGVKLDKTLAGGISFGLNQFF